MPSKYYDTFRPTHAMDGDKPIRRTESAASKTMTPVTPPWIPKLSGPRRTSKKASIKGAKVVKASTFEDI